MSYTKDIRRRFYQQKLIQFWHGTGTYPVITRGIHRNFFSQFGIKESRVDFFSFGVNITFRLNVFFGFIFLTAQFGLRTKGVVSAFYNVNVSDKLVGSYFVADGLVKGIIYIGFSVFCFG